MDFDQAARLFRVVILGESSVGKTSIIDRLVNKEFNPMEAPTIGACFLLHHEQVENVCIEMQIWDTAGQEKYKALSPIYCRGAAAAIVTFDVTSRESFDRVGDWIKLVQECSCTDTAIFVAANKWDLKVRAEVSESDMTNWSSTSDFKIVKTSAKTGEGVTELFKMVAEEIFKRGCVSKPAQKMKLDAARQKNEGCC
jgi:small GTP-binding protein